MPELPEVETIRRRLAPLVEGGTLRSLEILDPRWCGLHPSALRDALEGRPLRRVARRGKYLAWEAAGEMFLAGEPCLLCGREVVRFTAAGRGTYTCESCQKRPRRRLAEAPSRS